MAPGSIGNKHQQHQLLIDQFTDKRKSVNTSVPPTKLPAKTSTETYIITIPEIRQ